jgi:hypothetical protein
MTSPAASFYEYLLHEVNNAGENFERAKEKVMEQTAGPDFQPGPGLLEATEAFADAMQLYVNALRRLAHFAAHQARPTPRKYMAIGRSV